MTKDALIKAQNGMLVSPDEYRQVTVNPAVVYIQSLGAETSRATMRSSLRIMAGLLDSRYAGGDGWTELPWWRLRHEHIRALLGVLHDGTYAARTANRMVIALKGVMREAWRMDLMPPGIFERMEFKLQRVDTDPTGRVLSLEEIHKLIAFARSSDPVAGDRNAALVAICYAAGLRRAEAARLMVSDYDLNTGTLRVLGKGKRVRLCYVTSELRECVHRWARKRMDGPLFPRFFATPSSSNKRRVSDRPLHPSALNHLFADLQKGSGVKPFTPHDLRRSFATTLLENGADVITVQRLMGHASINTTTVYDRRGEKAKKDAVELLTKPKWVPEKS